ncbi:hypothetical protein [Nocardioides baculatus]|uniref:ABC transporter substrate-binding protein n=1 Tax=Nocardioides baculatus TaxID=2801337 RepID=A0ABS1L6N1_9ACTN|nr:hypothetical protein [Nocardioides baculatus]MBL0747345.1 hypothetical protein [Nocardioides baculatus]
MQTKTSRFSTALSTGVLALVMALGLASVSIGSASAATPDRTSARSVVGKSDAGKITSTVVGKASDGGKVTGSFTPTRFVQRDGVLYAKGFLEGKITHPDGSKSTFSGIKKMPVKKINGQSATDARTAGRVAACDILNLVLGPLDLNVLGLQVSLQRVVLDIVAVAGAGQLLGNLLCAVAGLLDGSPLAGLLGQLTNLLNQILAALGLGI